MRLHLLVALTAVLALAGCAPSGSGVDTGRFRGPAKDVARTLDDLSDAARSRDGGRVCAQLLSSRLVDQLDRASRCRTAVDDQLQDADVFDLDVDAIRVTGNTAVARVKSNFNGDKVPRTLLLVRKSGRWRLDGVRR